MYTIFVLILVFWFVKSQLKSRFTLKLKSYICRHRGNREIHSHQPPYPSSQAPTLCGDGDYLSHTSQEHSHFQSREHLDTGHIFHPHDLSSNDPVYPLRTSCDSPSFIRSSFQNNHELDTHASPNIHSESKNEANQGLGWTIFGISKSIKLISNSNELIWSVSRDDLAWKDESLVRFKFKPLGITISHIYFFYKCKLFPIYIYIYIYIWNAQMQDSSRINDLLVDPIQIYFPGTSLAYQVDLTCGSWTYINWILIWSPGLRCMKSW